VRVCSPGCRMPVSACVLLSASASQPAPTQAAAEPAADAAAAPEAGAAPAITFPDDYPNSVRHFLLIGFLVSAPACRAALPVPA